MNQYQNLFPHKITKFKYPKPSTLIPTAHTWISHDGTSKPFLGHFVAEVNPTALHRLYPTHFYIFEDANSPLILLSYAASERLGILEFRVPSLVAHSYIDSLTVPTCPTPGSLRKTAKHITFWNPLFDLNQPHCTTHS